jgi:hypothetical protein
VTDVIKITEAGFKIMLSIGDKIAENALVELSVAIPVHTMIPARPLLSVGKIAPQIMRMFHVARVTQRESICLAYKHAGSFGRAFRH